MSIKTGLPFFLTFCCSIIPIFGIIDHYSIMENFKKIGKNKNKLKQYTLKIMKILRTASLGSNFTGSYKKGCKVLDGNRKGTFNFR